MTDTARITGLRARAVAAPLAAPHVTASGTLEVAPLVLVDIATDAGITGIAYAFAYTPLAAKPLAALVQTLEPLLAGQPVAPRAVGAMLAARFRLAGVQGMVAQALATVDIALWDASAKLAGLPLARFLGGQPRPLPAYDGIGMVDPGGVARDTEASLARGFRAFKLRAGRPEAREDLAAIHAARGAAGADAWVALDFNQAFTAPEAVRRMRLLDEAAPAWIEEPVLAQDHRGHAEVRAAIATPVQTGENWWGLPDMRASLDAGASDLIMPDAIKIGGVSGFLDAAALAAAEGRPMSSHLYIEVSAHLLALTPTAQMLEWFDIAGPVLAEPATIRDGHVTAPERPGHGMAWDEAAIARFSL